MLRRTVLIELALGALLLVGAAPAAATPAPPPGFGSDDGAYLWLANNTMLTLEYYDAGGYLPGSTFGMYFQNNPSQLIPIFRPGHSSNQALVMMNFGVIQTGPSLNPALPFNPAPFQAGSPLGFYLTTGSGAGATTLFTDPSRNAGGADRVTTHVSTTANSYLIDFFSATGNLLAMEMITGLGRYDGQGGGFGPVDLGDDELCDGNCQLPPGNPVPEPETWLVFLVGLLLVVGCVERRKPGRA